MSGYDAFLSFANYMKSALVSYGINVYIEEYQDRTAPYLLLENGPVNVKADWLSEQMCQGWIVVKKNDTEPLAVSMGKAVKSVMEVSRGLEFDKYDYSQTPTKLLGIGHAKFFNLTGEMPSDDILTAKKVITWVLNSNDG